MHIKEHYLTRARARVHIWRQLEIIRYRGHDSIVRSATARWKRKKTGERDKIFCIAQCHCRISTDSRKHATKRNFRRNRHPCGVRGVRTKPHKNSARSIRARDGIKRREVTQQKYTTQSCKIDPRADIERI